MLVDRLSDNLLCATAASKTKEAINSTMLALLKYFSNVGLTPGRGNVFSLYREVSVAFNIVPFYFHHLKILGVENERKRQRSVTRLLPQRNGLLFYLRLTGY